MVGRDDSLANALRAATAEQVAAALSIPGGDAGWAEARIEIGWDPCARSPVFRASWRHRWGVGSSFDAAMQDLAERTLAGDGGYR